MNHEPTSIKKCEKNETNGGKKTTRVKATGKDHGGKEGRRDSTITNKQRAKTKYVIFTHGCCELLFGPHCPAQRSIRQLETQPQSIER